MSPSAKQRFVNEAIAASALNHPNVATVYDVGETESNSFIAMELVEGETLKSRLKSRALDDRRRCNRSRSRSRRASHAAHSKGIVHRDIKPDNLLLTLDGRRQDSGLRHRDGLATSGLTQTGMMLGTLSYMSPEQVLGEEVDHRSDLWSFGVVLYEMLARAAAVSEHDRVAVLYEILESGSRRPSRGTGRT